MPVPTPFLGLLLGWFPREVEGHTGNTGPQRAAWLGDEPNETWAPGTTGSNLWGYQGPVCMGGGGKGGNPMTLGSLLFPGLLDRLGVQSPQEAILGGSPSPPASSRRSPEADPSPGPQATPKGHQLGVTVPRRSREGPPMRFKLYPHPMLWGPVPVTIVLCMARRVLLSA